MQDVKKVTWGQRLLSRLLRSELKRPAGSFEGSVSAVSRVDAGAALQHPGQTPRQCGLSSGETRGHRKLEIVQAAQVLCVRLFLLFLGSMVAMRLYPDSAHCSGGMVAL